MLKMWGRSVNAGNAPFQFAPAEGTQFFEKFGWKEHSFHSTGDDAKRLKREMRYMWLWRLFGAVMSPTRKREMKRFSGVAVLERT
jgi:hypothetical protein